MAPGALIRVDPNKTLTLTNCKLFSCSELWNGILLREDNVYFGNLTLNNTTIEDMYNGIVADYDNGTINTSSPTGSISITGSTLNKNYVSVQIKNSAGMSTGSGAYPFSMKTSTVSSYASSTSPGSSLKPSSTYTYAYNEITNGTMGTSSAYLNFPRSFTGIYADNMNYGNYIAIGDRANSGNTNTFDNLDFGINGSNTSVKVHNNYFKNITGSPKQSDIDTWTYPASGPDEIGIAVVVTQTVSGNLFNCYVGDNTSVPSGGNPYPLGNKFEDCNKGVQLKNNRYSTVKGNYFTATTTSTLVQTTSGNPPVYVTNPNTYYYYKAQSAEYITAIGTSADLSYNYIRNHSTGIYANHTLVSGGGTPTLDITDNDIAAPSGTGYCMQAIQVDQSGGTNFGADALNIYNNRIEQTYKGIVANSVLSGLLIKGNTINVEGTGKTLNYSATSQRTGIILNNCEYGYVKGNSLTQNGSVPTTTTTAQYVNGVYLTNSKLGKVECNSTTGLGRCFVFQQNCSGNTWLVNAMSNSYTGLEIRTNGVIGNQGALTYTGTPNLSANTWTTITRETYAVSSPSVNQTSKLFLLAGSPTQPTLNFASGSGTISYTTTPGFGINVTTGTSYTCNSGSAQRVMNGSNNNPETNSNNLRTTNEADTFMLYTILATQDESAYEFFPEEMTYLNKQSVFKLLKEDSIQAVSGTVLDNFYQQQQNSSIDRLTEVQKAIANFDITNGISTNSSIAPVNTVEYKHQRANEFVLKYMQNCSYKFNSAEMTELYRMASECIAKGYYVVQSRNLVNSLQNAIINFEDNCEQETNVSRRIKETFSTKTNFYLYPNPNNGSMILDYDLGNYVNATVHLFDIAGKIISTYKLSDTKGILQMNEQNLNNGVYFYSILVEEKTIKTDKIVIIK